MIQSGEINKSCHTKEAKQEERKDNGTRSTNVVS